MECSANLLEQLCIRYVWILLAQALELSESVRTVALARLHTLHPDRTQLELVELLIGIPLIPTQSAGPPV